MLKTKEGIIKRRRNRSKHLEESCYFNKFAIPWPPKTILWICIEWFFINNLTIFQNNYFNHVIIYTYLLNYLYMKSFHSCFSMFFGLEFLAVSGHGASNNRGNFSVSQKRSVGGGRDMMPPPPWWFRGGGLSFDFPFFFMLNGMTNEGPCPPPPIIWRCTKSVFEWLLSGQNLLCLFVWGLQKGLIRSITM